MPFMCRRALPNPRSAPPAPCDTTSAAPTRKSGTPPPGSPASSAPGRTATGDRSPAGDTPGPRASAPASRLSMPLEPLGQRAAEDRLDRPVANGRHPRTVDPPPTATVERRSAAPTSDVVAARNPTPSFTSITNSPRPRAKPTPATSGILPSSDRGPGPPPPVVRLRRTIPSRRPPGPGPRVPHSRLSSSMPLHFSAAARTPATPSPSASCNAPTSSTSSSPFGQLEAQRSWFRPPATRCVEGQPALLGFALDVRAVEHVAPAVRTHRRQRQPHVDGEPGHAAQALLRHRLAALRRRRRADAHPADAARSTPPHRQTHDLVLVRARRRLQPAEPAGHLVRSRRHRPAAYHGPQACPKSTRRSPLESHEIAQSGSFRIASGGESLPDRPRPGRSGQCARAGNPHAPRPGHRRSSARIWTSRSDVLTTPGPPARPTTSPAPAPSPAARRPASRSAPRPPAAAPRSPPRPPPARSPAAG